MDKIEQIEKTLADIHRWYFDENCEDSLEECVGGFGLNAIKGSLELSLEIAKGEAHVMRWKKLEFGELIPSETLIVDELYGYVELDEYAMADQESVMHIATFNGSPVIPTPKETK